MRSLLPTAEVILANGGLSDGAGKLSENIGDRHENLAPYRALLLGAGTLAGAATDAPLPYDVIIEHGRVIDGTGSPWFAADIGIRAGRIAAIGRLDQAAAKQRIDAAGRIVAPGFIDMLGQSELTLLVNPHVPSKIFQGITTEITGEGESVAPVNAAIAQEDAPRFRHYGLSQDWTDFAGYFSRLEKQGIGINIGTYVGATTVREMVVGFADRRATAEELARMQAIVAASMRQGALGVSSALEYAPAPYASTEELIALASTAAQFGGIYATHMRSEQEAIMASIDETIRIAREAHIPVEIWHLKAGGVANFGLMPQIVARIDRARAAGWTSRRTLTPTPRGTTSFRRSFLPGRMTAATPSWSSACEIRPSVYASRRNSPRRRMTGTTNGSRCRIRRRF